MAISLDIARASERIRPYLPPTPLLRAAVLGDVERRVFLKCENLQVTGSFKVRGAYNAILSLSKEELSRGIITASTGNHGRAVAHALGLLGVNGTVYVPTTAAPHKVAALRAFGVELVALGEDSGVTEAAAREAAEKSGRPFISPYNDQRVIEGQGTIAAELLEQLPEIDAVYMAVGGGGLAAGIAAHMKAKNPAIKVVGCWPENATALYESMRAGRAVDGVQRPTLSDATAGGVEEGSLTIELCRRFMDDHVFVSEAEIAAGIRLMLESQALLVEGASGVALGGYATRGSTAKERNSVVVLSGGNIGLETLLRVLSRADETPF